MTHLWLFTLKYDRRSVMHASICVISNQLIFRVVHSNCAFFFQKLNKILFYCVYYFYKKRKRKKRKEKKTMLVFLLCLSIQRPDTVWLNTIRFTHCMNKQKGGSWAVKPRQTVITRPSEGLMLVRWTSSRWADCETSGSDDTHTMCSHTSDRVLHYRKGG